MLIENGLETAVTLGKIGTLLMTVVRTRYLMDFFLCLFYLCSCLRLILRYKFVNYPRLRTPSDYSKGSLLHKKREADRMLEWQVRRAE